MAKPIKIAKRANKYLVLEAIRKNKDTTIEELTNFTGLSRPTVLTNIRDLQKEGVVTTSGFAQTDVGRQPVLYTLNTDNNFAIGIDVDVPPTNLVVTNSKYEIVYSKNWAISFDEQPVNITNRMVDEIESALNYLGINHTKILGIGLGLPASIDAEQNKTVRLSRLLNWKNYDISSEIQNRTNIDIYLRNDAHLMSIAEHKLSNGKDNSLFIVLRSGIGSAAIIDNRMYDGALGNAGYIGHTTLRPNGRLCDCGLRGCYETYCSKRAITKDFETLSGGHVEYVDILNLAEDGDPNAISVLETAGEYLGIGISNLIKIYEIYSVILGDISCTEEHIFFQRIVQSTRSYLKNFTNIDPDISTGKLTSENFGLGGCYFVLGNFFSKPVLKLN